jgi:hypothetical protein
MDKLACALKDVPQSIINQIITDQMKKKVREAIEDEKIDEILDAQIEKAIVAFVKKNASTYVKQYLDKEGADIIKEAIESSFDDNGVGDDAYSVIQDAAEAFIISKFKKGGKK